jgi:aminopeptidase
VNDNVQRLADLLVSFGANVQEGQILDIRSALGKEELTRAITASAYKHGAKFVDVSYWDPHVKRERLQYAAEEALPFVPPWHGARTVQLGEERAAMISLSGPTEPHLFDDVDPARLGRDVFPRVKEWMTVVNDQTVNWCIGPCPTASWAALVHPDVDAGAALAKLWEEIIHICRLDEADPQAAWRERRAALKTAAERLTERAFDTLHLEGPGTDLTIGLLPSSRWIGGGDATVDGIDHMPNLPTEEVFTAPDPERVEGVVRATMPLFTQGRIIEGLTVRFEGGRVVEIDADSGAETLRAVTGLDDGAARLGEVALVDREGRIGPLQTVFYDTLLDENAVSHIALGDGVGDAVSGDDVGRVNRSAMHIDFMIGSDEVEVTGLARDGTEVPLLRGGAWQL